jgi:glycosyltransferase involved in cell wall biosynthesis
MIQKSKPLVSVVIPVYRSEETLRELCVRIKNVFSSINFEYEIVLIDDSSPDKSWKLIEEMSKSANEFKVIGIQLSKNFGQHNAIFAGLKIATGDYVVVMDADLQDQPEDISKMLEYLESEDPFDLVFAIRGNRGDTFFKRKVSSMYWKVFSFLTGIRTEGNVGTFGAFRRVVIDAIVSLPEANRNFGLLALWVGFRTGYITVNRNSRKFGKSSYNFSALLKMAIANIVSYSNRLLSMVLIAALFISVTSVILGTSVIITSVSNPSEAAGWASLIAAVFFSTGLIMLAIGVSGLYIGQILNQARNRPSYIVSRSTGLERSPILGESD